MQEDLLHYLWKFKKFDFSKALTSDNLELSILDVGSHNYNSGPDFFNAKIEIEDQLWAGNVEIHIKSSDWYLHRHEKDPNYDNVILHVVWEDDMDIFRKDNSTIPTLELKNIVSPITIQAYNSLLVNGAKKWINCEKDFFRFDDFTFNNWLERVYFERLETKSIRILEMLQKSGNNWEEVLFKLLLKNFGSKVNADAFESLSNHINFKVLQKTGDSQFNLEALLFGQARLLEEKNIQEPYCLGLQKEYSYLKRKFELDNSLVQTPRFFRLRPDNFPNIRLSQFSDLVANNPRLFSKIIESKTKENIYELFQAEASEFWSTHYTFGKTHKHKSKKLTKNFIDLIIINTIVPLKYCYLHSIGEFEEVEVLGIIQNLSPESNSVIARFEQLRPKTADSAMRSQALLQLKNEYCDKNRCLQCGLGVKLIQGLV
jgi:hypothetical protein